MPAKDLFHRAVKRSLQRDIKIPTTEISGSFNYFLIVVLRVAIVFLIQ